MRRSVPSLAFVLAVAVSAARPSPVPAPRGAPEASRPVVIGYVFPRERALERHEVRADLLTHVNYAFANVVGGRVVEGGSNDAANLRVLTDVRRDAPHLKVLVSVGGWTWSKGFSDAAATPRGRRAFAASAVDLLVRHDLDGIDVDWEYPGLPGDGNPHRPEDRGNFTALLSDLRAALDREGVRRGRPLLLTIAAGASESFLEHTEMAEVQKVVDFVNLMTYDFRVAGSEAAGHHANLRPSPADPRRDSVDGSVAAFLAAGVPASKLVVGVPFYGRAWEGLSSRDAVYREPGRAPSPRIDTSHAGLAALVGRDGWTREWDAAAAAPWLWSEARRTFVTYEDEESLRLKSRYVLDRGLAGVMFWEARADRSGALLDTLDAALGGGEARPLSGVWRFALDPADEGLVASWESRELEGRIRLPGALQAQGYGDDVTVGTRWTGQIVDRSFFTSPRYAPYREPGNVKVPFWLQPDKAYVGPAWYQRDVDVPAEWAGRPVVLRLERPHWQTLAFVDGRAVGSSDSLSTPHEHDLGALTPGRHRLTIRVDNRLVVDVGVNSHSVTDHTQGNWNGVAGAIDLRPRRPVFLDDVQVFPRLSSSSPSVRVRGRVGSSAGASGTGEVSLAVSAGEGPAPIGQTRVAVAWDRDGGAFEADVPLPAGARTWDEFSPFLHTLRATLDAGTSRDAREVRFGLREVGTRGTQITVNGKPIFVRGTLECAIFPKTGHPPTDVASWRRVVRIAKAHGLNAIRFHSWCPPEAAFRAADELGFYYQVEVASWPNNSTRLGVSLPVDEWLEREASRILRAYGSHPSFLLMAAGNEPAGRDREYLGRLVERWKAEDPRRLYTSASGWPQIPENQYHVAPEPRIQAWGEGLRSRVNARPPETRTDYREYVRARGVPVVSHEIGQWCAFPNLAERAKYTGYLKAKNFDVFADFLAARGLSGQAADFLQASGKLQALLYKEEIESALRTPGMGGFFLLDLHDFPGQGSALVGVLDGFWDSKGYVTPEEFRRFCSPTVLLARLDRRVFTTADSLVADVEVAHFGSEPLGAARPSWRLVDDAERTVARGSWAPRDVATGGVASLGRVEAPLGALKAPARYRLVAGLDGTPNENAWDVWVYPRRVEAPPTPGVRVVHALDSEAEAALHRGESVVLLVPPARVRGDEQGPVALGFSSIFWNTAWTGRQAPHTLGILCDPAHPALADFPTDGHSDWQWWYLVTRAGAMILDGLPRDLRPVVQVVDDWFTSRRLGLVFEARVGRGRLLVASIDLDGDLAVNPVARQMRRSLLRYAASERFRPVVEVAPEAVRALY